MVSGQSQCQPRNPNPVRNPPSGCAFRARCPKATALCASAPEDVNALAEQVDADGTDQTVCAGLPGGDLMLTQNVSSAAEQPATTAPAEEGGGDAETATAPDDADQEAG